METMQSLKKSIQSAENLHSVVSTMKAHASTNITQFQNAAEASREYRRTLDMALHILLSKEEERLAPQEIDADQTIHIVFGSDHGLAGRFNERITGLANSRIPAQEGHQVIVIGQQVMSRLETHLPVSAFFSVPQTQDGITPMVQRLLAKIDELRGASHLGKILLYYNKPLDAAGFAEEIELLFPLDFEALAQRTGQWNSRSIPTYLMDREQLLSDILQQYFFITLYRTYCFSLASENASRLASMESAEKNIEGRLEELDKEYRMERQNSITEEINDIISGFKGMKKAKGG